MTSPSKRSLCGQLVSVVPENFINILGVQNPFGPEVELFRRGLAEPFLLRRVLGLEAEQYFSQTVGQ